MKKIIKKFVVRKYIYADSAFNAIKNEKSYPVDDVWVDDDWKRMQRDEEEVKNKIGFK